MVLRLDDTHLQFRDQVRKLGVLLDLSLSWESQIAAMSRSAFNQLRLITQCCPYLDKDSFRTLVHSPVISHIDCCNALMSGFP